MTTTTNIQTANNTLSLVASALLVEMSDVYRASAFGYDVEAALDAVAAEGARVARSYGFPTLAAAVEAIESRTTHKFVHSYGLDHLVGRGAH